MPRAPGTRLDGYRLVAHLADGAQAEVHLARSEATGEQVVVKIPHPRTLDQTPLVQRWRREVSITEDLRHPNLQCRVDVGQAHSEPYLALEYAAGGTLRQRIADHPGTLPVDEVVAWAADLARALGHLHRRGIVHRDVKPDNLYLTAVGRVKLGDFGAAIRLGSGPTRPRLFALPTPLEGTPEYLSPEQALGRPVDPRSDLYSWGVVVFELLTGEVPLTGTDPQAVLDAHLRQDPGLPSRLRPEVPPGLDAVVAGALRRHPEDRYGTAEEILADLERLDDPDLAGATPEPDPPWEGSVGGDEARAVARVVGVVLVSFLGVVAAILALSAVLRG